MDEKTLAFIEGMRIVGRLAADTLRGAGELVAPGVTPNQIDKWVYEYTMDHGATPATLNYHGYPKSICTSVNEVVCHGLPDDRPLEEGDIINIDVTSAYKGFFGDNSATFYVGEVSDAAKRITEAAYWAMHKGIEQVAAGKTTGDIGYAVNRYCTRQGFFPVEDIGGHGIGTVFHSEPFVPSVGKKGRGYVLKPWTCITVEPMVNETSAHLDERAIPGSTHHEYFTADRCLSAQFEHTLLVTDKGYEIMTLTSEGKEVRTF
ncbi:MAG: type I methionyl aminopeptidase [Bdellovibrionaceae bacterium]|nr:type I methionyl aminopeptidase [Pseudobdellovibrionaceae bacterium]